MTRCDPVRIAFLDVGQGDSSVIHEKNKHEAVIVDCCDANAVLSYLQHNQLQRIRGLIITHLHSDHCRGVPELLSNATCEEVLCLFPETRLAEKLMLLRDPDGHSDLAHVSNSDERTRRSLLTELVYWTQNNRHNYKRLTKQVGQPIIPMPEIIELVHPWEVDVPELLLTGLNNTSAVLKIRGLKSSALLMGDLEPQGWQLLKKYATNLRSDVLKFPHHGGWRNGDPEELLDVVAPSIVVISVGTSGSRFDHPNLRVLDAISEHSDVRLLCTQATEKCSKVLAQTRSAVVTLFEAESRNENVFFVEQLGCPCAGTVVVELGNSVEIIQPTKYFHHDTVIHGYFSDDHKCLVNAEVFSDD